MNVRDIEARDEAAILALNLESEAVLSPMDATRYAFLLEHSDYARVVEDDGNVVAFLLAMYEGVWSYDSPNYQWFNERVGNFLYVDRVVVAHSHQGRGIGAMLYDDVFKFARDTETWCVTCEFDIEPPNEASRRFHARYGFVEVGTQDLAKGKRVSLQSAALTLDPFQSTD